MATIGVIIVNYNAGEHLARCVASLDAGLGGHEWAAVIVDNASTDGSLHLVADFGPRVVLVESGANVGFGRAVNAGAARISNEYLLLTNPDCRLTPRCVDPLLDELTAHPSCGVVAPRVENERGLPEGNARGDPSMLTGLFGRSAPLRGLLPSARVARRNVVLPEHLPAGTKSAPVDWAAGSCLLVRRRAFEAIGGFDERYFLYWEDADLCRRLRAAGWSTRFRVDAVVTHVGGQSARQASELAVREFHRSAYLYYRTHVARSTWDPRRPLARLLLAVRARGVRSSASRGEP